MKKIITLLVVLLVTTAFGSGFQINENGAKAMSLGGAFTGLADDASAVFYNPGAVVFLDGINITGGATAIAPTTNFKGPSPEVTEYEMESQIFTPINLWATYKISDKWAVGCGLNNPYGMGTDWKDGFVGRFASDKIELRTFYFTAIASYKVNEYFSIGVGPRVAYADVIIEKWKDLAPFNDEALIKLEGDGTGYGAVAGAYWKNENLSFGITVRSETKLDFEGDATSEGPAQFAASLPKGDITADITTPLNAVFGLAYHPTEKLTFVADIQYIGWSSYDVLAVEFEENEDWDTSSPRNYKNTYIYRFGTEYDVMKKLSLRGGIFYDKNPVPDKDLEPSLPDSDRIGLNGGFGWNIADNMAIDVAYLYLYFYERKIDNSVVSYTSGDARLNGVYNNVAHLFGINFSYKF